MNHYLLPTLAAIQFAFALLLAEAGNPTTETELRGDLAIQLAESGSVKLPAWIQSGRSDHIKVEAERFGVRLVDYSGFESTNAVLTSLFSAIERLESERNAIIARVRSDGRYHRLGKNFLISAYGPQIYDPNRDLFVDDFDQQFVRRCAASNDLEAIRQWRLISDLLIAGEVPLLVPPKQGATVRPLPQKLDQKFPQYQAVSETILLPLSKFDQTLSARVGIIQEHFAASYFESYASRISSLDSGTLQTLQSVKIALESPKLGVLIESSLKLPLRVRKPDEALSPRVGTVNPTPQAFPLSDPTGFPPLPTVPCRLVIVASLDATPQDMDQPPFRAIERDDLSDLVKLGDDMVGTIVVALRKNGTGVIWNKEGKRRDPPFANLVAGFNHYFPVPVFWLDGEGKIQTMNTFPGLSDQLKDFEDIVSLRIVNGGVFCTTKDGKRHFVIHSGFSKASSSLAPATRDLQSIHSISPAGAYCLSILRKDGSLWKCQDGSLSQMAPAEAVVNLQQQIAVGTDGKMLPAAGINFADKWLSTLPVPGSISKGSGCVAMRYGDRVWRIATLQNQNWAWNESLERALGSAIELRAHGSKYIYALFPADEIPRSGVWDLEELTKALKK